VLKDLIVGLVCGEGCGGIDLMIVERFYLLKSQNVESVNFG
jgi:hypothetical protein